MHTGLATLPIAAALAGVLAFPADAQDVDADRLMDDLRVLAADSMEGRRVGSPGNAAARRHIVRRLADLGVRADSQVFEVERGDATLRGVNVVATLAGTRGGGRAPFVVTAHYDHLGVRDGEVFNGADDNASGTAALLAIAEALVDRPAGRDVTLAFLDAEEGGLNGARVFVGALGEDPPSRVAMNLNLDMVSRSDAELWVAGTHQNPALRPVVETVRPAPGVTLRFGHDSPAWQGAANWSGASDHAPFDRAAIPFLYFGVEDHPDYHRPTDTADRVDAAWFAAATATILRALRALDDADAVVEAARSARGG